MCTRVKQPQLTLSLEIGLENRRCVNVLRRFGNNQDLLPKCYQEGNLESNIRRKYILIKLDRLHSRIS